MNKFTLFFGFFAVFISSFFHLLGLMNLIPLFLTIPLLFLSILFTLSALNNRNRFKGFKQKRMW
ncbi:hypothetical protein [Bacillus alveayuensis]|uniref:hypothetical protein n=1 Tax=Aeribacillus alveayuensis TaxID=279215 RepID=UPI000A054204|nr:hypothetical protein [Bacillus alveayuensis]